MMDCEWLEKYSDHLLVEGQSTQELLAPLKRSSRLKYNCVSVSNKLVAIGSNTGGIYIFSRTDQKLLQVAFADKETNSVSLVKLSPHEKYVAFVSSSNVHVLDLKLESRSKAETLRSTSDLSDRLVTCLLWDQTSAKLYIGDDLGKVSMMPVYSNKAKNLFSLPLEVIMKLDSAIVQLDKAEEKILVSTITRCYLCDTTKQQYSQIGKKLRDGHFGACFLTQDTCAPMIYCARPGSRIWEVDYDGNVLNTHQFKQLLAVPPSPVITLNQEYSSLAENSVYKGQSVVFPKLITLRNNFLLTWTRSAIYILDTINVKVILWTNQFSGIQDICCVDKEIYIFFESMELQCVTLHPVTCVIPLFLQVNDVKSAANMCVHHRNVFLHKHFRKIFGVKDLYKIYDRLVSENMSDLAEQIHEVIISVENKIANESESETSSSGRSRSGSAVSAVSTNNTYIAASNTGSTFSTAESTDSALSGMESGCVTLSDPADTSNELNVRDSDRTFNGTSKDSAITGKDNRTLPGIIGTNIGEMDVDLTNADHIGTKNENFNKNRFTETETDNSRIETAVSDIENSENQNKEVSKKQSEHSDVMVHIVNETVDEENKTENIENREDIPVTNFDGDLGTEKEMHNKLAADNEKDIGEQRGVVFTEENETDKAPSIQNNPLEIEGEGRTVDYFVNTTACKIKYEQDFTSKSGEESSNETEIKRHFKDKPKLEDTAGLDKTKPDFQTDQGSDTTKQNTSETRETTSHTSHVAMEMRNANVDVEMENEDDVGYLPVVGLGARRLSLTSLSSVDSGEVFIDQPSSHEFGESSEQIAIPVKRKTGKKKRRRSSVMDNNESKVHAEGRMTRSLSAGTMQQLLGYKERAVSPQGSVHSVKEEDSISVYSNDSLIEEGNTDSANTTESKENTDSFHENQNTESLSIGSPMSVSGEFGQSGEFHRSLDHLQNRESSPREHTLAQSWEKNRLGQTPSTSAPKTALLQLKNKMQTKVSSGTKNLIRNIKEKNLLSKAKEFAENLSQGSEAYLHSGGSSFQETPDILMSYPDFGQHLKDSENQNTLQNEGTDAVDGQEKPIADCAELELTTALTKEKLQDVETLMNPDTVCKVLLDWVTVLNKTFQEMHIKKYGDIVDNIVEKNELSDSLKENESVPNDRNCDNSVGTEVGRSENNQGSEKLAKISQCETGTDCHVINEENDGAPMRFYVKLPDSVLNTLKNKTFCHLEDPLCLSNDVFQDVCELAQASFDMGCYGNILNFSEYKYCDENSEATLQHTDKVVDNVSNIDNDLKDKTSGINEVNKVIVSEEKENLKYMIMNGNSEGCIVRGNSGKRDETEHKDTHFNNKLQSCVGDTCNASDPDKQSKYNYLEVSCEKCSQENEHVGIKNRVENTTDTGTVERESSSYNQYKDSGQMECMKNTENIHTGTNPQMDARNSDRSSGEVVEESCEKSKQDGGAQDKAMGYFVRCYFPYLSVFRIREETLRKRSYHLWCALLTCMEGKAGFDGEKYGIADTSVINYLLENQAALDNGAMLLGHISSLFQNNLGSVVDVCVRCHPFVHPIDVMYMCRYHQVAVETVFRHYMIWMTVDETSAIKAHILSDVGKDLETCLMWLELLLSEDTDCGKVVDEHGCPRCMAHKVSRKNEALIGQLIIHIQTEDDKRLVLELCRKYGYWLEVLKILKNSGPRLEHLKLVLQLGDIDLLNGQNEQGYIAHSVSDWQELLITYQMLVSKAGNQTSDKTCSDWSKLITWNSLAVLLVRNVGSVEALSLLDKHNIPEGVLSLEFYQACLLSGMVQRQQRLVLHSMLEKIDSYLWSQRPTALTPQIVYLANVEKKGTSVDTSSTHTDVLQTMVGRLKERRYEQFVEDPECHWGIETKINLLCPCCGIALKETVTHDQPGVLIFKCGHGYHKLCLPLKECILCDGVSEGGSSKRISFI